MPPGPFGPLGRGADSIIPLHDTQRTQRCRHHPLDDYNKCFNVPKKTKKHTHLKLISFYCFFKKVLISLIKEKEEPVLLCRAFVCCLMWRRPEDFSDLPSSSCRYLDGRLHLMTKQQINQNWLRHSSAVKIECSVESRSNGRL